MRFKVTKSQLRHAKSHGGYLRLAHELRNRMPRARAAIVGGSEIPIEDAPWQVFVESVVPDGPKEVLVSTCGGSILNEGEILTAGHCVINPLTGTKVLPDQIVAGAGISNLAVRVPEEQLSLAREVLVHPYYNPNAALPSPDDVALLKLEKPFVLNGSTARSIALTSAGSMLQEGTAVNLTGFGEENPVSKELNGTLDSIGMSVVLSRDCGGEADAVFLCASTSDGSLCLGDSGGGLTGPGSSAALVGVADTVQVISGVPCRDGAVGGFANVAAPEIRDFVEGDFTPPRAPRGAGAFLEGSAVSGGTLSCDPGAWSGSPTFTYTFVSAAGGQILQQGSSPAYPLTGADVGRTIGCDVLATNAGGTGFDPTAFVGPVQQSSVGPQFVGAPIPAGAVAGIQEGAAAPVPDAKLASTALAASASGAVTIKVSCPAVESSCSGTVTLRTLNAVSSGAGSAAHSKKAIVTLASGSFTLAGGFVKTITLHLSAKGRALLSRSHVLHIRVTIVAHDPAGAAHTTQTVATLRAPKARHGKG